MQLAKSPPWQSAQVLRIGSVSVCEWAGVARIVNNSGNITRRGMGLFSTQNATCAYDTTYASLEVEGQAVCSVFARFGTRHRETPLAPTGRLTSQIVTSTAPVLGEGVIGHSDAPLQPVNVQVRGLRCPSQTSQAFHAVEVWCARPDLPALFQVNPMRR